MRVSGTKVSEKVRKSGLISENSTIVVGVSGGPDSLTLLHLLLEMRHESNLTVVPVHVNHGLRENAGREEAHLARICAEWGVPCVVKKINCREIARQRKCSLEEAGREERYRIFSEVAKEVQQSGVPMERICIAVAHNADDQCETLLQRIIRGTGIHGLRGIPFTRKDEAGFTVIRPLLAVTREEIEEYVREKGLEPNYDESNWTTEYNRNRIRLELIPYMEKNLNPGVKESLRALSEIASMEDDYMEQEATRCLQEIQVNETSVLDAERLQDFHPAIEYRVLARFLNQVEGTEQIGKNILGGAARLVRSENPSARMDLPGGYSLKRQYNLLILESPEDNSVKSAKEETLTAKICEWKDFDANNGLEAVRKFRQSGRSVVLLDYDILRKELGECLDRVVLRGRMPGDRIGIAGGKHKKLQNYLVDGKIPREQRNRLKMVAVGSEILWILPDTALPNKMEREFGKISQKYQIQEGSNAVLFLEIK